jgi:hypothetical protein
MAMKSILVVVLAILVLMVATTPLSMERGKAKWTFIVFLNADNNLYDFALEDLNEMETAGSTSEVNIVVLLDGPEDGDSRILQIVKDEDEEVIHSLPIDDKGRIIRGYEANMGDLSTLKKFIRWVKEKYPADHEVLVIWDHGSGIKGFSKEDSNFLFKGISYDETNNDYLTIPELKQALDKIKVDIIGFDACLMQMLEIVWLAKDHAKFIIGSQELVPEEGWDYQVLNRLTEDPAISPMDFSKEIVKAYGAYYGKAGYPTQSAAESRKLNSLVDTVNSLANILMENIGKYVGDIESARSETHCYGIDCYIDLYHFAEKLEEHVDEEKVKSKAEEVMRLINATVSAEIHSRESKDSHGISIYFPERSWDFRTYYRSSKFLDFAADSLWDEFLEAYYDASSERIEIKTDKEAYELGEPVKIKIKNVGYKGIEGDLEYKIDLEERKIYEFSAGKAEMKAGESVEYEWRQIDLEGEQVQPGEYSLSVEVGGCIASTTFTIKASCSIVDS